MPSYEGRFSAQDIASAGIVARNVELDSVVVQEGSFSLQSGASAPCAVEQTAIEFNALHEFDEEQNIILVKASFVARSPSSLAEKGSGEGSLFSVSAVFLLRYRLTVQPPPKELRDALFPGFAQVNGAYNAWPYLREFVQSCAMRAGLLPMTLPVLRVPRVQVQEATPAGASSSPAGTRPSKSPGKRKASKAS